MDADPTQYILCGSDEGLQFIDRASLQ